MTEKLLSRSDCAQCRQCCSFESYGLRSTPTLTDETAELAARLKPSVRFAKLDGVRLFLMDCEEGQDLYYCPMLDHSSGCMLGGEKPFECRIFPFTLMSFEGRRVLAVSAYCPVIGRKPLDELRSAAAELAPEIFTAGSDRRELVRPFENGYVILIAE